MITGPVPSGCLALRRGAGRRHADATKLLIRCTAFGIPIPKAAESVAGEGELATMHGSGRLRQALHLEQHAGSLQSKLIGAECKR